MSFNNQFKLDQQLLSENEAMCDQYVVNLVPVIQGKRDVLKGIILGGAPIDISKNEI